jgi:hypothetical protein
MSGQAGMRGYMIQSLISVLDSFNDYDWTSIAIEPNITGDKVDILWTYPNKKRATQVKSSQNQITKGMCQSWVSELENSYTCDEYSLSLIGPVNSDVTTLSSISKTLIPTPHILNIDALIDQASNKFDKFLEQRSISKVPAFAREILIQSLVTKFETYSTSGKDITRSDFTKTFDNWILTIYPNSINKAAEELQLLYQSRNRTEEAKFKLKHEACIEALSVVDEFYKISFADEALKGKNIPGKIKKLDPFQLGEKVRVCHNKLVLTCDSPKVFELFKRAIKFDKRPEDRADIIVDLRKAIREELGFGETIVDEDRNLAWILTCG